MAVRPEKKSTFKMVPMALAALLTVIGTHSRHLPMHQRDQNRHKRTPWHTNAGSHLRRLWRLFSFARRRSSTSAWSKPNVIPPVPLTFACEKRLRWANRWLPRGAASSLHDVARQGFDGSTECLCKHHGRSSVRHAVQHTATMSTITATSARMVSVDSPRLRSPQPKTPFPAQDAISEHSALPALAVLPLPCPRVVLLQGPSLRPPCAQSRLHSPFAMSSQT